MSNRIEFYKNRGIGERLSVAFNFLKQNWKALYKNILIGGLPLAIIMGYLLAEVYTARTILNFDLPHFFLFYALLIFVSFLDTVYLYSMTGAVLHQYERNQLTESTGWNDLKDTFFKFAGKTALIFLLVFIPIIFIIVIPAVFLGFTTAFASHVPEFAVIILFFALFLMAGFIVFAPFISMLYFPAYFSGKTVWESIKTSFVLGFKDWGSLFLAIMLLGIVFYIIYMIFYVPLIVSSLFSIGYLSIFSYIFATLSAIGMLLSYPVMIVVFAFQYFSIVEKEEGVSLQSRLDDFENL